jgi:hypothetical protein
MNRHLIDVGRFDCSLEAALEQKDLLKLMCRFGSSCFHEILLVAIARGII